MSVAGVVEKLEQHGRVDTVETVSLHAHFKGEPVRLGKAPADMRRRDEIGIITHEFKRLVAVEFIKAHRKDGPDTEGADKFHEPAHAGLAAEALAHLLGPGGAYALYLRELFRLGFKYLKRPVAELPDDERRCSGAYALDGPAGEIRVYRRRGGGYHALGELRLELAAVGIVSHPAAADDHGFARRGIRERSDDRDVLIIRVRQAKHGIAVLLVFIDNRAYGAGYL